MSNTLNRHQELKVILDRLKLVGMSQQFADLALRATKEGLSHEAYLHELAKHEGYCQVDNTLETIPASTEEWKQEFLDFAKSRNLSRSYKPVMLKALFRLVDREGKVHLDDLARAFRVYYIQQLERGQPLEQNSSLMAYPNEASDQAVKRLIITNPLERFLIKNFIAYFPEDDLLQIDPRLWQALFHYEVKDALASADEQIQYYLARQKEKDPL